MYDHNLKSYDFHYENEEEDDVDGISEGYWGYLRDRNADKKNSLINNPKHNSFDGYWGFFKDANFDPLSTTLTSAKTGTQISAMATADEMSIGVSPCSNSPSIMSLSSSINSLSRFKEVFNEEEDVYPKSSSGSLFDSYEKKLEYDYNYYKTSKLKIQACKRDE